MSGTAAQRRAYTVVGGGAIGGTIAFHLAKAGHPVLVVDQDTEHVGAISDQGLGIRRPDGRVERQPVRAITPDGADALPATGGGLGAVVLAVKAQATDPAVRWIAPRLAEDGFVVSLQNGLCEEQIAAEVGERRTVTAFVNLFADLVAPGLIADGGAGALVVGELDGRVSPRVERLVTDLRAWGPAVAHPNVAGHLWSKQSYSVVGATSALVDVPIHETIEAHPDMTVALAREVYAVGAAIGVHPESFDHWEAGAFAVDAHLPYTRQVLADFCGWLRTQPKNKTGIWRDLAVRKRPTEVPAMLAPVLRLADDHGINCPGIRTVVRLIGELERGERRMDESNVTEVERAVSGR
ncbi:ketopantoate reductase family protein [Actinacidiphila oryziradicis]|jgi:2-dehydropantoate 2-reductase|uniref:2-dehydropantoate 2-reductase n=1 Tax=Actinacidiphila oryziradicis TaxID=2571141 RepID=A0A4U0S9A4_9ACTN|nr:2-dehydropantoate 2-reductase N-terminal domain-containing protein [Actinacidiphila oryziradicis]TKA04817.1 hypothetical protein FCI23_34140 [Actinacidiphila oryziradicis]